MSNEVIANYAEPAEVSVARRAAGAFVSGNWSQGALTTLTVVAAVLPASPEELKLVEAGQEETAGIAIYSDIELRTINETAKTEADVVTYGGKLWLVKKTERRWQLPDLAHYKSIALLKDGQ